LLPARLILPFVLVAACRTDPSVAPDASGASSISPGASSPPTPGSASDFGTAQSARPLSARAVRELALDTAAHSTEIDKVLPGHAPIRTESDSYLLVAAEPSAPLDQVISLTHDTVTALLHGPVEHRPERAFTVWVFATPERQSSCGLIASRA
jgi:hypothetical protein